MEKTRVEIRVDPAPWSEHGADAVEILISPNPGEEPKPLDKIASGGELSRVALALKTCTAPAKPAGDPVAPWSSTKWMPESEAARPKRSGGG